MKHPTENVLLQMLKISKAALRAQELTGKTIVYHRREVLDETVRFLRENPEESPVLFGVKNTGQIKPDLVERLKTEQGFFFHTVDKMAERGRAIDTDLVNPLTGRVMTGSSSASSINILKGINDLAIGTDGGGSVLAPAVSTGLYSVMAKGLGLQGSRPRVSTDNINFLPGIGVISHSYHLCKIAISSLTGVELINAKELKKIKPIKLAVPKRGSSFFPDGRDIRDLLDPALDVMSGLVVVTEKDFNGIDHRKQAITFCNELFDDGIEMIMTIEGPVDLYGTGDSVLGGWGMVGSQIQKLSGKSLLKVANMVDATALSLPTGELATGFLLLGKPGIQTEPIMLALGDLINGLNPIPPLFTKYFTEWYQAEDKGFI